MSSIQRVSLFSTAFLLVCGLSLPGCADLWKGAIDKNAQGQQGPDDIVVESAATLTDAVKQFNDLEIKTNTCNGYQLSEETVRKAIDDSWPLIPAQFQPSFRELHDGTFKTGTMSLAGFRRCQFMRVIIKDAAADIHGNILSHSLSIGEDRVR